MRTISSPPTRYTERISRRNAAVPGTTLGSKTRFAVWSPVAPVYWRSGVPALSGSVTSCPFTRTVYATTSRSLDSFTGRTSANQS